MVLTTPTRVAMLTLSTVGLVDRGGGSGNPIECYICLVTATVSNKTNQ